MAGTEGLEDTATWVSRSVLCTVGFVNLLNLRRLEDAGGANELLIVSWMEYTVVMAYLGGILSENAYKFATRGTKPFVKIWMRELAGKVKELDIEKCNSYEIGVFGKFTDERRPDISNLFKIISDAIEKGLGVNDKNFRLADKGYELGHIDPELVITIKGSSE